jgi:hypothetical protein
MAEGRKILVTLPDGRQVTATEIPVEKSDERWSEYTLQDGTIIRGKINIISISRVENEYDATGQPVYQFNAAPALGFVEIPDRLKRGARKPS